MQNMDAKMMALKALRAKIRKMEMEDELGGEKLDGMEGDLDSQEKGSNNMAEDAREIGEAVTSADGEDGEKGMSVELEIESDDPTDAGTMEDLYKRMAAEFGAMPKSRNAPEKKTFRGGMGNGQMAAMMGSKKRK